MNNNLLAEVLVKGKIVEIRKNEKGITYKIEFKDGEALYSTIIVPESNIYEVFDVKS